MFYAFPDVYQLGYDLLSFVLNIISNQIDIRDDVKSLCILYKIMLQNKVSDYTNSFNHIQVFPHILKMIKQNTCQNLKTFPDRMMTIVAHLEELQVKL